LYARSSPGLTYLIAGFEVHELRRRQFRFSYFTNVPERMRTQVRLQRIGVLAGIRPLISGNSYLCALTYAISTDGNVLL
jgi:hypothetical protein